MIVSEQIIQVIDALCAKAGVAIDWTSENIMPYLEILCHKLVTYEIGVSIAELVYMILLSLISIIILKKMWPRIIDNFDEFWVIPVCVSGGMILMALYVTTIFTIYDETIEIIKCLTFPELYVFEYIQKLLVPPVA